MSVRLASFGVIAALVASDAGVTAQPPETFTWTPYPGAAGSAYAWAGKGKPAGAEFPHLMLLRRETKPGPAPGTDVRTSSLLTVEIDCGRQAIKAVSIANFDEAFVETDSAARTSPWSPVAALRENAAAAWAFCAPNRDPNTKEATIAGAQAWLDATMPKPRAPPTPPAAGTVFEYVGVMNPTQAIDIWLETSSLQREGNIAKAWVFQVWQNGWSDGFGFSPGTWRLQEFECGARPRDRNIWFVEVDRKLAHGHGKDASNSKFSVTGDTNTKAAALRVCQQRPLLFSETYAGDLKSLVSEKYGAGPAVGSPLQFKPPARPAPVDLGPVIRFTENDGAFAYHGVFTRAGAGSPRYDGEMAQADGSGKYAANLYVKGVVDGYLIIHKGGPAETEYRIPVTNGKVAGKGISLSQRANDAYTFTLVEPTTILP